MASEAQRLIGISLTKIAQSRTHRGGVSLHKNLLVATVLQKARYIFMEEAYNMVHYQAAPHHQRLVQQQQQAQQQEELVGLTAEEAGIESMALPEEQEASNLDFLQPGCVKCASGQDKENQPPTYHTSGELTYLDLDKTPSVLKDRGNCLKRRRAVTEWETEEAVQSILPKRRCTEEGDDSVFLDDATLLSETVSKELETEQHHEAATATPPPTPPSSAMEIDRITSLVSIFSFGIGDGKLNRSVSTPDLCSSQAKEGDSLQQRPCLAMIV